MSLGAYGKIIKRLGEGAYGKVYLYRTNDGKEYAIKRMNMNENNGIDSSIINDISTLKLLDHHNIVKVIDVVIRKKYVYMVLDVAVSDLSAIKYNEKDIPLVVFPLVKAMAYYFNMNILHLDIKPQNVLLFKTGDLKFTDFGLSKQGFCSIYPDKMNNTVVTMWYRSIDILMGSEEYDEMADIWAFGCILYEMHTHYPLFMGNTEKSMIKLIFTRFGTPTQIFTSSTKITQWVKKYPMYKGTGFTETKIISNPLLLDLLLKIFDYSNFMKPKGSDHITWLLKHPYFFSKNNNSNIIYKRLSCYESLYNYNYIINNYEDNKLNKNLLYSMILEIDLIYNLNLKLSTIFLSYSIMNRYFIKKTFDDNELSYYMCGASLLLACSMNELYEPHALDYLFFVNTFVNKNVKKEFTKNIEEFLTFKNHIITSLDWTIYTPTSFDFLNILTLNEVIPFRHLSSSILLMIFYTNFIFEKTIIDIAIYAIKLSHIYLRHFNLGDFDNNLLEIPIVIDNKIINMINRKIYDHIGVFKPSQLLSSLSAFSQEQKLLL